MDILVECPLCLAKVGGELIKAHEYDPEDYGDGMVLHNNKRILLLKCQACNHPIIAGQTYCDELSGFWDTKRLWPQEDKNYSDFHRSIPSIVRECLVEARKTYNAEAYKSCAMMCGQTLEAICKSYNTKAKKLGRGLKELLEREIIDKKIYSWSEELTKQRHLGAHAFLEGEIEQEDAKDLLDFVNAICEYIFVLTKKFDNFMKRKDKE